MGCSQDSFVLLLTTLQEQRVPMGTCTPGAEPRVVLSAPPASNPDPAELELRAFIVARAEIFLFPAFWLALHIQARGCPARPAINSCSWPRVRPRAFITGEQQLSGCARGVCNSPSNVSHYFKFLLPIFISFYLKSFFSHPEMIPPEGDFVGNIAFAF